MGPPGFEAACKSRPFPSRGQPRAARGCTFPLRRRAVSRSRARPRRRGRACRCRPSATASAGRRSARSRPRSGPVGAAARSADGEGRAGSRAGSRSPRPLRERQPAMSRATLTDASGGISPRRARLFNRPEFRDPARFPREKLFDARATSAIRAQPDTSGRSPSLRSGLTHAGQRPPADARPESNR